MSTRRKGNEKDLEIGDEKKETACRLFMDPI